MATTNDLREAVRRTYADAAGGQGCGCKDDGGCCETAGFESVSVTVTHQVADGMHGAIVKAVKA